MSRLDIKIRYMEVTSELVKHYQREAKELGYDEVGLYWESHIGPYVVVGVDEGSSGEESK